MNEKLEALNQEMHTLLNYSKENRKEILWNNTGS